MTGKKLMQAKRFGKNVNGRITTKIRLNMWDANIAPLDALMLVGSLPDLGKWFDWIPSPPR